MAGPAVAKPLFQKRALVPLWVLQIILMLAIIISDLVLGFEAVSFSGASILLMSISAFCIIFDLTEIILYAGHRLHPLTYLILQLVKTITWTTLFGLSISGVSNMQAQDARSGDTEKYYIDLAGLVETALPFLFYLGSLIYGSVIYHRHRHAKDRTRLDSFALESGKIIIPEISAISEPSPTNSDPSELGPSHTAANELSPISAPITSRFNGKWRKMHELDDDGWVQELDNDRSEEGLESVTRGKKKGAAERYELATVNTPKPRSERTSRRL